MTTPHPTALPARTQAADAGEHRAILAADEPIDGRRAIVAADEPCAAPGCELTIGEHPPVDLPDVPDGPMRVFGVVAGNAACAYRIALAEATGTAAAPRRVAVAEANRCEVCGEDARTCTDTRAARAWTTRLRQVPYPLQSGREPS